MKTLVRKPSPLDKTLAGFCVKCPACRRARKQQRGTAFWLVKKIELKICPFCRAYERVYGRKAHERRDPNDCTVQVTN
jgi:uncharacterized protein CbrC (UPF0167 family)